jgi:hypothetical protein
MIDGFSLWLLEQKRYLIAVRIAIVVSDFLFALAWAALKC